jgi:hypothetical protein
MGKRFTETTIWDDDWFYELSPEYKLFWFYVKDNCNHAGIWQPKIRAFKAATDADVDLDKALSYFNMGKNRVRVLPNGRWYIEDFYQFQYGHVLNVRNRVHKSVLDQFLENGVSMSSIVGLTEIISIKEESVSPKLMDDLILRSSWGQFDLNVDLNDGLKDKDKDKEKDSCKGE